MDLDFTSGTTGNGNKIKSEPMDFETSTNGKDHLNAKRPQDAALMPGAKAANKHKATTPNIPNSSSSSNLKSQPLKTEAQATSKVKFNDLEIKALKNKPM